jgi:hypothetical protein
MLLAAAAACILLVACGGDGGDAPSADEIEQAMADQLGADGGQAACIRHYLVEDYEGAELRDLVDDGMGALPQARWEPYLTASLACLTRPVDDR